MRLQTNFRTGVDGAGREPLIGPAYVEDTAARDPVTLGHVRGRADHADRVHRVPARGRQAEAAQRPDEAATTGAHRLPGGLAAVEHDPPQPATSGFGRRRETRGSTTHDDDVNPVN